MCSVVTIHYRFHPLHGRELSVERIFENGDPAADCVEPVPSRPCAKRGSRDTSHSVCAGRIRVPVWMTRPEATAIELSDLPRNYCCFDPSGEAPEDLKNLEGELKNGMEKGTGEKHLKRT